MNNLAPVVIFVYNRPLHTRQTLEALQKNELAVDSDLIIYADGAKNAKAFTNVKEVRGYLKTVTGFKSVTVIERDKNWGLAANIIDGVTDVVNRYGKVIVMEDDIVTSPAYLQFMNQALDFYKGNKKIWHVSGWSYPIDNNNLGDAFLWRVMNCWGWATWADRWQHFEKNPNLLIGKWSTEEKYHFDLNGSGVFWPQVEANAQGKINTWAIFWYASIFDNGGLCLNPSVSYVDNIGHDGSGVHCGSDSSHSTTLLNESMSINFPSVFTESELAVLRISDFYKKQKKSFSIRLINKMSRTFLRRNII